MPRRIEVATLVIKLASRCNMDCSYCYIYHGQDSSWRLMPPTMSPEVITALVDQVDHLYQAQQTKPQIVFHGGEPLLLGPTRLKEIVSAMVARIPSVTLSIQTNGTIYNDAVEQLLLDHKPNIVFSVSVDGHKSENDRHRIGLRNRSVYNQIEASLKRASAAGVLDGILMVVDVRNDPARIHDFMCSAGSPHFNILLQDGDFDHLPPGKSSPEAVDVGDWLWRLFKAYASGPQHFRIKFFDDISLSILKIFRGIETGPPANYSLCTMTIDTNGEIKQSDTYRVNSDGADRLVGQSILSTPIYIAANSPENQMAMQAIEELPDQCLNCRYLDACGGGFPPHRSRQGSFLNPSIYCKDYLYLFERMESSLCQ